MIIKSAIVVILLFLKICITSEYTVCKREKTTEWHPQPKTITVNWTLRENICFDFYKECWKNSSNTQNSSSTHQELNIPQICPLQLQVGDVLIISSEPSSHFLGMNLVNVSKDTFINCLQNDSAEDQLLFGCKLKGKHEVNPQWLNIGTHYFLTKMTGGPLFCKLGLRLNVTVKQQFCQASQNAAFCSGHGRCLSEVWNKTYVCHCHPPYSGEFCQEVDECIQNPCHNNGICIKKREQNEDSCDCICYPHFTGKNCTEIIGHCQPHLCLHGNCRNMTANTFICECDEHFTGPFCEELLEPCLFQPCWNRGICHNQMPACIFDGLADFLGPKCETEVDECLLLQCQSGVECLVMPNDATCMYSRKFTAKFCDRILKTCDSMLCGKNATSKEQDGSYHCRWMPGFTGRNCEEVIKYCRLLSVNCLNEGLYFNIIGRFRHGPGQRGSYKQPNHNVLQCNPMATQKHHNDINTCQTPPIGYQFSISLRDSMFQEITKVNCTDALEPEDKIGVGRIHLSPQ
ncbi:protein eyes shut homolog [Notamacropus eugenii]|uniref:protein eyes shut homolog n=1 Tax=Notamacropus eugenii TaxID=9315 RepID=UPI003B683B2F